MTKDEVIMRVYDRIPSSYQIKELDTTRENEIRFSWRGSTFRVGLNLHVEKVEGGMLKTDNEANLLRDVLGT